MLVYTHVALGVDLLIISLRTTLLEVVLPARSVPIALVSVGTVLVVFFHILEVVLAGLLHTALVDVDLVVSLCKTPAGIVPVVPLCISLVEVAPIVSLHTTLALFCFCLRVVRIHISLAEVVLVVSLHIALVQFVMPVRSHTYSTRRGLSCAFLSHKIGRGCSGRSACTHSTSRNCSCCFFTHSPCRNCFYCSFTYSVGRNCS